MVKDKKNESKPARKRGRPRKQRSIEEDSKMIRELFDSNGNLVKNDELEKNLFSKLSKPESLAISDQDGSLMDGTKIKDLINSKIQTVDQELALIETEYQEASRHVLKISEIKNKLVKQRLDVNSLIEKEQNLILTWEAQLERLPENHFSADKGWLSRMLDTILDNPDEISLRQKLAKSETIVSQWTVKLVEINDRLAEALVGLVGYENILEAISGARESYRTVRLNLGKVRREIQVQMKDDQAQKDNQLIMKNYLENLNSLKNLGTDFAQSTWKNKKFLPQMLHDLKIHPSKLFLNSSYHQVEFKKLEEDEELEKN